MKMSIKRYVFYNVLIFCVYVQIYLYPGLTDGGKISNILGKFPPVLIIIAIGLFQSALAFVLYKYREKISRILKARQGLIASRKFWIVLLVGVFVFFAFLGVKRHLNLETAIFDFSLEEQVVWNTSQGRFFEASVEVNNYLGDHVSFLTVLPSAVYHFIPSPFTLIFIQVGCVLIGAFGIKKMADREIRMPWVSLGVFLMCVFYIGLSGLWLGDYRPILLSIPFLVWGLYFLGNPKRQLVGSVFIVLAALGKEDMAVFAGTIMLYQFLFKRKRWALFLSILCYGIALFGLLVIIPHFRGTESDTISRYAGISGLFKLGHMKIEYVLKLFFPVLLLALVCVKKVWVLIPNLMMNLASTFVGQLTALNQYDIATGIIIFWSTVSCLKTIKFRSANLYYWMALLFIVNLLLLSAHTLRWQLLSPNKRYDDYLYVQDLKKRIPNDAVLAATNMVGGQFGQRRQLYMFDLGLATCKDKPDYVVVDKVMDLTPAVAQLVTDCYKSGYVKMEENSSFLVLIRN